MSPGTAELLADALRLSDEDRAALTEQLLASFEPRPGEVDPVDDAEFLAELDRRADEFRNNPTAGLPWEFVKEFR